MEAADDLMRCPNCETPVTITVESVACGACQVTWATCPRCLWSRAVSPVEVAPDRARQNRAFADWLRANPQPMESL
jgi:hypothetical protein